MRRITGQIEIDGIVYFLVVGNDDEFDYTDAQMGDEPPDCFFDTMPGCDGCNADCPYAK